MKRVLGNSLVLILVSFLFFNLGIINAENQIDFTDSFIQGHMVMNLSQLANYSYGGMWTPYSDIDLRYISKQDGDQHSEFRLQIYNSSREAKNALGIINPDNLKIINGNKISEEIIEQVPAGNQRRVDWISGNNIITGWNGNDLGSIIDDTLFNTLVPAYLQKYPSTYDVSPISSLVLPNPANLIIYYPFEGNANDTSGRNNTGRMRADCNLSGKIGLGCTFLGYSYIDRQPLFGNNNSEETISLWVKPNDTLGTQTYVSMGSDSLNYGNYLIIQQVGRDIKFCLWSNKYDCITALSNVSLVNWTNIIVVHSLSRSYAKLYINNILVGSMGTFVDSSPNHIYLSLGMDSSGINAFKGRIDEVGIWNTAFNASEVSDLYHVYDPVVLDLPPEPGMPGSASGIGENPSQPITANDKKDMTKYLDQEVFLTSDKNWKDVLPWVSASVWTSNDSAEYASCSKPYGGAKNVCAYPFLVYHDEEGLGGTNFQVIPENFSFEIHPDLKINNIILSKMNLVPGDNLTVNVILTRSYSTVSKDLYLQLSNYPSDNLNVKSPKNIVISGMGLGEIRNFTFNFTFQGNLPGFDVDSIIHFMQQYQEGNEKITIIGNTSRELDNLLITQPSLGVGLNINKLSRITPSSYFYYWKNYTDVVYVEDNYETALMASTYASLINAPLIINGTGGDVVSNFISKNVICVGNVNKNCSESYSLEQLQQKYVLKTNTSKIILTNPADWNLNLSANFQPKKSSNRIYALYGKTSLMSPFLASAKQEILFTINSTNYTIIDNYLKFELGGIVTPLTPHSCKIGENCSSGFSSKRVELQVSQNELNISLGNMKSALFADSYGYAITLNGLLFDCNGDSSDIQVYFNNQLVKTEKQVCYNRNQLLFTPYGQIYLDKILYEDHITNLNISLRYSGNLSMSDNVDYNLLIQNSSGSSALCRKENNCLSSLSNISIDIPFSNVSSYYEFNNLNTNTDYFASVKFSGNNVMNASIYFNDDQIGNFDWVKGSWQIKPFVISQQQIKDKNRVSISPTLSYKYSGGVYFAEVSFTPDLSNYYLTLMAAPNAIPYKEFTEYVGDIEQDRPLDQTQYGDFNNDLFPDISVSRIQGITLSDVSSYLARDLFYNKFKENKNMKFLASSFDYDISLANSWSNLFRNIGFNAVNITSIEVGYFFSPSEWLNQSLVSYQDHGAENWAGIASQDMPELDNSLVFSDACSTCATYDSESFCNTAIRNGALAHLGAVCVAWLGNLIYMNTLNGIYYDNLTLVHRII